MTTPTPQTKPRSATWVLVLASVASLMAALDAMVVSTSMLRELGGVLGIAVVVAVFAGAGSYASPTTFSDGFAAAIAVSAALSAVGAIAGLGLPGRARASTAAPKPGLVPAVEATAAA